MTAGPAAPTTILYASLDHPNEKLVALLFAAEALRRGGAKRAHPAGALSLLHASGRSLPRRRSDQPKSRRRAACRMRRSRDHSGCASASHARNRERCFPGIAGRQSVGHARDRRGAAQRPVSILQPSSLGRTPNRGPGSAISPAGSGFLIPSRKRPAAATVRSKLDLPDPACIAGRPALIVDDIVSSGGTMMACAKALAAAGRDSDRCGRHARAVPEQLCRDMR